MAKKKIITKVPGKNKTGLTAKQELFCKLFASDREFFGNGVQAYIEAYDIDLSKKGAYANAKNSAYDNLTKPDILRRIDELLELGPLNNQFVDKQLAKVITQDADFPSKVRAINEYNKLQRRIEEKVTKNTIIITPDQLQERLNQAKGKK